MQKQDALLDYAISHSPAIFYIAELEGDRKVTFISPNIENITGHKVEAFLSELDYGRAHIHPDDLPGYLAAVGELTDAGVNSCEYRFRRNDGSYLWFRDDLRLTAANGTGAEQMVGCMIDITERKAAEDSQREISSLMDDALESIPHGFALYGSDDYLLRCNSAFAALYGVAPEELVGLHVREMVDRAQIFCDRVFDPAGTERDLDWTNNINPATGASFSDTYEMRTKDGRWFLVTVHPTSAGATAVLRTDISDQKQTQASLRDAEAFKAGIIDSAIDCIIAMDEEGCVVEFNPAAERTFGFTRDTAMGQSVSDLIIPEAYRRQHDEGLRRYLGSGEKVMLGQRVELKAQRADGSTFPAELSIAEVDAAGRRVFTASLRDITEQKRARKERKRLIQILNDAIESIPSGFAIFDSKSRLTLCNTAYAAFHGAAPAELVGESCDQLLRRRPMKVRAIEGQEVTGDELSVERFCRRMSDVITRPVELQMQDGRWIQITGHATSEGGEVVIRSDITNAKQAEAALREREQHYRRIVEAQPLPVWMVEVESGTILYESRAASILFGRTDPTTASRDVRAHYVRLEDRAKVIEALRENGIVDDLEVELKKRDGSSVWVSATSRLMLIDGREVIISSMIDLTERRQREAELRQARETLEDAIESLSEGFALFDAEDRLVMCNQRYRDFNEQTSDILVPGVKWLDFIRAGAERGQYSSAVGRIEEWVEERQQLRANQVGRLELQQTDGRWFEVSNQRTRAGGIVVTRADITQRKEMEKVLRESEALVRRVLEAAPLPVGMTRASDGLIIYESPASKALFRRGQIEGEIEHTRGFFANPADRERYLQILNRRGYVDDFEVGMKNADGEPFWASLSARLAEYKGEKVIVSSTLDLTERRAVESEMAQQREALHQSEKLTALGSLLAGVAHELNNPLSVVVGQALLLQETAADTGIVKRAAKIGAAADRCARIIRAFLAMARQRPPERAEVNVNAQIESVAEMLAYSLKTEGVEFTVDLNPELPPVWGDADQINQVLVNLLINARQALADIHGDRMIALNSEHDRATDRVLIRVSDNGPGVPEHIRSRIFDPFFTTKEVGAGTGIGLSVSYGIVESHGGTIELDCGEGRCTTFVIALPAARPEQVPVAELPARDSGIAPCNILIVDDEPDIAQTLGEILSTDSHSIETADSGVAALRRLAERDFDIILCDLRMPDLDGRGLYEALQKRQPQLLERIAFMTGDTFGPRSETFCEETGRPCLEKPFTPEDVRRTIEDLVNARAQAG